MLRAEVVFLIGANPTSNHPVAATWMKNAVKAGVKLIVADPRRSELARHAAYYLQFKPDTDVALLNAMIHTIIEENLVNEAFVKDRTSGYEALKENSRNFSPEKMAPICGIPAQTIREVARLFATSKGSMILWGMGISQHVHGTDNARCLIALTLMTGPDRPPGHRAAPAARAEQRAGRLRLRPHPHDVPGLSAGEHRRGEPALREALGHAPGQAAGPHGRRDHERRLRRQDPRHVHHGREPGDVRPGCGARAGGDGEARAPRRAGHLPHRNGLSRRRGAAGDGLAGKGRHGDQHRPHGAARPPRAEGAGRCPGRPLDHRRVGQTPRPYVVLPGA